MDCKFQFIVIYFFNAYNLFHCLTFFLQVLLYHLHFYILINIITELL